MPTVDKNRYNIPIYSNFDHEINKEVIAYLQDHPTFYGVHHAWNFVGYVWYEDGRWYEEVWQYQKVVNKLAAWTAEGVINLTNVKYGSR